MDCAGERTDESPVSLNNGLDGAPRTPSPGASSSKTSLHADHIPWWPSLGTHWPPAGSFRWPPTRWESRLRESRPPEGPLMSRSRSGLSVVVAVVCLCVVGCTADNRALGSAAQPGTSGTSGTVITETNPDAARPPSSDGDAGPTGSRVTAGGVVASLVPYRLPGSFWTIGMPASWSRTEGHGSATFSHGADTVRVVAMPRAQAPTVDAVRAAPDDVTGRPGPADLTVRARTEPSGSALEITWTAGSDRHDTFLFWHRGVQVAVSLVGPIDAAAPAEWPSIPPSFAITA
jgi:hypothetical protein